MTKTYAVIGDPIDHSLSPAIHNAAFAFLGLDCTYIAYRIPKDDLAEGIESLKLINIAGFNVTIPHKVEMMKLLDCVDEDCKTIGATNTVDSENGKFKGYNTDMDGFLEPIKKRNLSCKDSDVLLVGAGGAARAIVAAFAKEKSGKDVIKGDGDPLDICVLSEHSIAHGDIILKAIPIGGFRLLDKGEADDKIIAVMKGDEFYESWKDIKDCPPSFINRLKHYFLTYKNLPGEKSTCEIVNIYGKEEAQQVILKGKEDYENHFGE